MEKLTIITTYGFRPDYPFPWGWDAVEKGTYEPRGYGGTEASAMEDLFDKIARRAALAKEQRE
jgi:hypothetical protein